MGAVSKKTLLRQASILGVASILVRAIGLLYRIPLSRMIGDLGNSYYGIAFNIYSILLLLSGYSIPVAISKISSAYIAQHQYRNAQETFRVSLLFMGLFGALLSIALYGFAPYLLPVEAKPAVYALRALAPTLFFSGFVGVFQGYFQSRNNTLPTASAQILEQLVNALTSIFFAFALTRGIVHNDVQRASLGALGGTIGTLCGVITALIILVYIYHLNQPIFLRQEKRDRSRHYDDKKTIFRNLTLLLLPIIFSTVIYNVCMLIDQYLYYLISDFRKLDPMSVGVNFGIYVGKVIPITNIPSALAYSVSVATLPLISAAYTRRNRRELFQRIHDGINFSMLIAFPAMVGLFVLADPIMQLLFSGTPKLGTYALMLLSFNILTITHSTVLSGTLQGMGKPKLALQAGICAIVVNVLILTPLLLFTNLGVYAIILSVIPHSLTMSIVCMHHIKRLTGFRPNPFRSFVLPGCAATIMGIITFFVYHLSHLILRLKFLALLITIPTAIICYATLILTLGIIRKQEFIFLPGGRHLIRILHMIRLI